MYKVFFKRFFDIVISLCAMPFFLIAFIFLAPAIYFTDKGPVFYNAERIGKNGKLFKMYKFRSMYVNAPDIRLADGSTYNGEDDPRVTKIGKILRKTSLDEIPQVLNVFLGNMSVIGPRPDPPDWLDIKILFKTVFVVFKQENTYKDVENEEEAMKAVSEIKEHDSVVK